MNENGGTGMDDERGADTAAGADVLETRYRLILMLLPTAYREHRGEEMISTLLDGATEGRRWPSIGEVASLAALATRLRVGAPGGTRRAVAVGEVLRRTALTGLLVMGIWHAIAAVTNLIGLASVHSEYYRYLLTSTWLWPLMLHIVQPVLYFGAFTALLLGRRRLGRFLGVTQVAVIAAEYVSNRTLVAYDVVALTATAALIAVAAGLGFHREAAPLPTPRHWLTVAVALAGFVLIVVGVVAAFQLNSRSAPSASMDALVSVVAGPLVPVLAAVFGVLRARRSPIWPAALLLLGLPGLVLLPEEVITYVRGRSENLFVGELFTHLPWMSAAIYMVIVDTILAVTLAWALYRNRARSNAVAA